MRAYNHIMILTFIAVVCVTFDGGGGELTIITSTNDHIRGRIDTTFGKDCLQKLK